MARPMEFFSRVLLCVTLNILGAATAIAHSIDLTKLPLGDGRWSTTTPQRDYIYVCRAPTGQGQGASTNGPWIGTTTWNLSAKISVDGSVAWPNAQFRLDQTATAWSITGNGLPSTLTGVFPIARSSAAYAYDTNPNSIKTQSLTVSLPLGPAQAVKPSCMSGGAIGVFLNGAPFFNALDEPGRDAPAHEVQDKCGGHPEISGTYHFHMMPTCMDLGDPAGSSPQIGIAYDGNPIYGPYERGQYLANVDLDLCHGRTSTVTYNGAQATIYHYVANYEYPYTIGCYRSTPVVAAVPQATQAVIPETGWWWDSSVPGRGYSIEVANGKIFIVAYMFRADGTPIWYAGTGTMANSAATISLVEYSGAQTLTSGPPASAVTLPSMLQAAISFAGPATGTITWSGAVSATTSIARFPLSGSQIQSPTSTAAPQTGWWWNSGESGTGYFIEVQGTNVFLGAYLFGDDTRARWYYGFGTLSAVGAGAGFSTDLIEASSGPTLTASAGASAPKTKTLGTVRVSCPSDLACALTLPNGRALALSRFTSF